MAFWKTVSDLFSSTIRIGSLAFPFTLLDLVLRLVIPCLACYVVYRIVLAGVRRMAEKAKAEIDTRKRMLRWTKNILRAAVIVVFTGCVSWLFGAEIFKYTGIFFSFLASPIIQSGTTTISIITIILLIPAAYVSLYAGRRVNAMVNNALAKRENFDESKRFTLSKLLSYLAVAMAFLLSLSLLGIDLSILTVLFGVLGIGLGFGLQNVVANFFAGFVLLFTRPIKEGDRIIVEGIEGTVLSVRLLSSVVNTLEDVTIVIPNSALVNNTVRNCTYADRKTVITNTVSVAYDSDLDEVLAVLESIGRSNPFFLTGTDPAVRVSAFEGSGIKMSIFMTIRSVENKGAAISWNNLEIWREFRRRGIEIPFPRMDVRVKEPSAPAVPAVPAEPLSGGGPVRGGTEKGETERGRAKRAKSKKGTGGR